MVDTNVSEIVTELFGDYIHEFISGWAKVCRKEDFRIRPFYERYGFQEDRLIPACQEAGDYVTEQILRMTLVLRERYNEALEIPNYEEKKSSVLNLTWEAIILLYTGDGEFVRDYNYSRWIRAYRQNLDLLERLGKSFE